MNRQQASLRDRLAFLREAAQREVTQPIPGITRQGGQFAFAATAANASFVPMSRAMPTTISSSGVVPAVKLLLWPRSTGIASPTLISAVSSPFEFQLPHRHRSFTKERLCDGLCPTPAICDSRRERLNGWIAGLRDRCGCRGACADSGRSHLTTRP